MRAKGEICRIFDGGVFYETEMKKAISKLCANLLEGVWHLANIALKWMDTIFLDIIKTCPIWTIDDSNNRS